jgi:SRSO17 transposase
VPRFIGWAPGEDGPWRHELPRQVAAHLGHAEGGLVFAPAGCPQSGTESVGVARQWCGRLGKVDHCQVALSWGYVSGAGHTLVALRLYLPKAWTPDKARRATAGGPNAHRG